MDILFQMDGIYKLWHKTYRMPLLKFYSLIVVYSLLSLVLRQLGWGVWSNLGRKQRNVVLVFCEIFEITFALKSPTRDWRIINWDFLSHIFCQICRGCCKTCWSYFRRGNGDKSCTFRTKWKLWVLSETKSSVGPYASIIPKVQSLEQRIPYSIRLESSSLDFICAFVYFLTVSPLLFLFPHTDPVGQKLV